MKKNITYDQLFAMDNDIKKIEKANPGLFFLLNSKVKDFYEKNQVHFDALNNGVKAIQKKFIVHDADGNPMMEGEGNNKGWKYVPVYTDFGTASIISNREKIKELFEQHLIKFTSLTVNAEL